MVHDIIDCEDVIITEQNNVKWLVFVVVVAAVGLYKMCC
jgi:hypothetical protein